MKINNNRQLYDEIMQKKGSTFGDYVERLICDSLGIEHYGNIDEVDGIDNNGIKYEIKSFNITIDKQGKQRYSYANGFGYCQKGISITKQIDNYCDKFDYLVVVEGNIDVKSLQVDILKDKVKIKKYLLDRIAICTDKKGDKTRFCYGSIDCIFDYRQLMRYTSIMKKGYTI